MLRHYVFLKYRENTNDAHVTAFCERMLGLRSAIEGFSISRSAGTNCAIPAAGTWC